MLGELEQARRALRAAATAAEEVGDPRLSHLALNNLAHNHMVSGELHDDLVYRRRALVAAQRLGDPVRTAFAVANVGYSHFLLGDWQEARAHYDRSLAMVRSGELAWHSTYPLLYIGELLTAEGRWDDATTYLSEGLTNASKSNDLQALRIGQSLLAEIDLADGRPQEAIHRLEPLLDRPGLTEEYVNSLLPLVAWANLELGHRQRAESIAEAAVMRARNQGGRLRLLEALRVRALVAMREAGENGRWDPVDALLREALKLARDMEYRHGEERVLLLYGRLSMDRGQVERARGYLQEALALAERLGAEKDAERARRALVTGAR
jgi:tetratricopeptide (TPR) repeat protein